MTDEHNEAEVSFNENEQYDGQVWDMWNVGDRSIRAARLIMLTEYVDITTRDALERVHETHGAEVAAGLMVTAGLAFEVMDARGRIEELEEQIERLEDALWEREAR